MADDKITNSTYLGYIGQAIRDFDSIFAKLVQKGVVENDYGTQAADGKWNTGVATSEYADLIGRLYRVDGATPSNGVSITYRGAKTAATGVAIDYSKKELTISGLPEGYINTQSSFVGTISPITVSAATITAGGIKDITTGKNGETSKAYVYEIPNNTFVNKVQLDVASLSLDVSKAAVSKTDSTATIVSTTVNPTGFGNDIIIDGVGADGQNLVTTGYKVFEITPNLTIDCEHEVTLTKGSGENDAYDYTTGYLAAGSVKIVNNKKLVDETDTGVTVTRRFLLKEAKLTGVKASGTISFADGGDIASVADTVDGYDITANASLAVSGNITAGYIAAGSLTSDGSGEVAPAVFRVKATKLVAPTITNTMSITPDVGTLADSAGADTNYYNIEIVRPKIEKEITIEEGYVKGNDRKATITTAAETKYVQVKKGSVTGTPTASVTNGGILSLTESGNVTPITLTVASQGNIEFDAGYIATSGVTASNTQTQTVYLSNLAVTTEPSTTITAVAVANSEDDGPESLKRNETPISIFTEEKPADNTGDYYEIKASSFVGLSAGYLGSATNYTSDDVVYLPKAKLKYVSDDENGNLITVEHGGYLPSGLLTDISEITGTLDQASVQASANGAAGDVTTVGNKLVYRVPVVYDAANSTPGYFFGTANFVGSYCDITVGSVTTVADATSSELDGERETSLANGVYSLPIKTSGTVKTTVVEGYIRGDDLTVNGEDEVNDSSVSFEDATVLAINKAVISNDAADSSVGLVVTSATDSVKTVNFVDNSNYKIKLDIDSTNNTIKAKASTGYIVENDSSTNLNVTAATSEFFIKAGSVGTIANAGTAGQVELVSTISDTVAAGTDYTIKVAQNSSIAATATITDGYVEAGSATGAVAVTSNVITVAHGSVGSTASGTSDLNFVGLTDYATEAEALNDGKNLAYAVTATGTITSSAVLNKAGYIKDADIASEATTTSEPKTKYIAGYKGSTTTDEPNVYTISEAFIGEDGEAVSSEIIAVGGKYVAKDIKVNLAADAMGTSVVTELDKLMARLNGNYVTANV